MKTRNRNAARIAAAALAFLLCAGAFTACSSQPGQSSAPAATTAPAATAEPTATPTPGDGAFVNGIYKYNETKTVKAMMGYNSQRIDDVNKQFIWEWARRNMNIDFQLEGVDDSAAADRMKLSFASADTMPDVYFRIYDMDFNAQTMYGDREHQLVDIKDYIKNKDIMPNLATAMDELPQVYDNLKTAAGSIYAFPLIMESVDIAPMINNSGIWYNEKTLTAAGIAPPKTLDELLAAAKKLKTLDPYGLGKNYYPIGGTYSGNDNIDANVREALGLVGFDRWTYTCMKGGVSTDPNGQFVASKIDGAYRAYLEYIHTLFAEGLINRDYYTLDADQTSAMVMAGNNTFFTTSNFNNWTDDSWKNYRLLQPLTSALSDKQVAYSSYGPGKGNVYAFITSKCEDPLPILRFMDVAYSKEYRQLFAYGPENGKDDGYGILKGWHYDTDGVTRLYKDVEDGTFENNGVYLYHVSSIATTGGMVDRRTDGSAYAKMTMDTSAGLYYLESKAKLFPYLAYSPLNLAFEPELSTHLGELGDLMDSYIEENSAKFVTGVQELNDETWNTYVTTLNNMGYKEYYDAYLAAFNAKYRQ